MVTVTPNSLAKRSSFRESSFVLTQANYQKFQRKVKRKWNKKRFLISNLQISMIFYFNFLCHTKMKCWYFDSLRNKKILKLCFRWHILRSYRFVTKVTFKILALMCFFLWLFNLYDYRDNPQLVFFSNFVFFHRSKTVTMDISK